MHLEFHMIAPMSVQNIVFISTLLVLTLWHLRIGIFFFVFVLGKRGAKQNVHNTYNCKTCTECVQLKKHERNVYICGINSKGKHVSRKRYEICTNVRSAYIVA